jgi:hypothetical protein
MRNSKTYTLGNVEYGYKPAGRGWVFAVPGYSLTVHPRHGVNVKEVAPKIAAQVNGSFKRCGSLDNLAKANIDRLTVPVPVKKDFANPHFVA